MVNSSLESNIDRPEELSWSEAEAMVQARLEFMEPEAILIFKSLKMNECRDTFDALLEFFGSIELVNDELSFASAIKIIDQVYDAFEKIDVNHDAQVSKEELKDYSKDVEERDRKPMEWILNHHSVLRRVCRPSKRSLESKEGISKKDLIKAGNIFRGLKHSQENFSSISEEDKNKEPEITVGSIEKYLSKNQSKLSIREKSGLMALIELVESVCNRSSRHKGLNKEELSKLGLEDVLNHRITKEFD